MKITFMGAGSSVFAKNVLGDTMLCPSLNSAEIALYDIDAARLEESYILITRLNENVNESRATVKKYLGVEQRKEALRDADFVINAIQVGGYEPCTVIDFEIRSAPNDWRYFRNRRHLPSFAYNQSHARVCKRYGRSMP